MSEQKTETSAEAIAETSQPGLTLRKARLDKGLSVADVASALNLTESAVNSLEADSYADLPGVTFVRGYIRAYARVLGLNADQLAQQYSEIVDNAPVKPLPVLNPERRRRSRSRFMLVGLAVFIILGVVVGYLAMEEQGSRRIVQAEESEPVFARLEVERADGTLQVHSLDDLDARTASMPVAEINLDAIQSLDEEAESEDTGETLAEGEGETLDGDELAAVGESADNQLDNALQLVFVEECWIRVTDAQGNELASGLRPAGTELVLEGEAPFELHLGNARGLHIMFKGQAVDFQDSIRGNVARLKLG